MIRSGDTLGILGGGQLGRMIAMSARQLGLRVAAYDGPGAAILTGADLSFLRPFDDLAMLARFAESCELLTYEWENVPLEAARTVEAHRPLRPSSAVLEITQDRLKEHAFLHSLGIPTAPGLPVQDTASALDAIERLGLPARLKTARGGYDGGGQWRITRPEELPQPLSPPLLLEREVSFDAEISVIVCRGLGGEVVAFPPFRNEHAQGILRVSTCPAGLSPALEARAFDIARTIAEALDLVGTLTVEMFLVQGELLVNELAPRVHNSGHLTIEATAVSQFEQHLRAIAGLPLATPTLRAPAAMVNLLGSEVLSGVRLEGLDAALALPGVHVHVYGKADSRPRRKLGHVTALDAEVEGAKRKALEAAARLRFVGAQ